MKVIASRNCDAPGKPGERRALFEGQVYDLPLEEARALIDAGDAVAVKAIEKAPSNKAVESSKRKRRRS